MTKEDKPKKKRTYRPQNRNLKLSDGTVIEGVHDNLASTARKGLKGKHVLPKKPFSTETGRDYEDYEVTDDYDKLQYPPRSKNPEFREIWAATLPSLLERGNFNPTHLGLLEVYCRLCVELRRLDEFVLRNGHTFRVVTVMGEIRKTYPEVSERHKVLSSLMRCTGLLDLKPEKDKSKGGALPPGEADEWK